MKLSSSNRDLRYAWLAGCAYAGLLLLTGAAGWFLQVGLSQGELLGYVIRAAVVLVFSRGLYHRSVAGGLVLLMIALGPAAGVAIRWMAGATESVQSASAIIEGLVALAGLVFGTIVIRGISDLWRGEAPRESRHNTAL